MAATIATIGLGVVLKQGDGESSEAFTDFGLEIVSTGTVGITRDAIEATHMQSPNGYAEMIAGLKRSTEFSMEFNWVPANTGTIQTAIEAAAGNWQMLFPDASTVTVAGFISGFEIGSITPEGKMTGSATFTPSGKATWA